MNSNDIDDSKPDTPTATPDATTEAPARPKRARKTAAASAEAVAAPAPEAATEAAAEAPPKPRTRRKPAAAQAEITEAADAAPAAVAAAPAETAGDSEAPAKPKRRTRAKVADADPAADAVESAVTASAAATIDAAPAPVSAVAEAVQSPAAGDAGEASTDAGAEESDGRSGRNRRRRGRDGREPREARDAAQGAGQGAQGPQGGQGGAAAAQDGQAAGAAPKANAAELQAQAQERFDDLLSGAFDEDDAVAGEDAELDLDLDDVGEAVETAEGDADAGVDGPGKRVLAPEPDAPKLQKVLAQAGVGSRRDIEDMIAKGQITVNNEVAHVGQRISYGDRIAVAGKPIKVRIAPIAPRILAYHKPVGEVVTFNDPEGRPTVFRNLPRLPQGKWQSVGRLDLNTEGLLLFTNSGELANLLMHPRFGVEREYAVRVLGSLSPEQKSTLLTGVDVDGQQAMFKSIVDGGGEGANRWYRVVITEGRNREVRKLFETVGLAVSRLIRIRYGTVVLPRGLKRGVYVELGDGDVRVIRQLAGNVPQERGDRADRGDRGGDRADRGDRNDRGGKRRRSGGNGGPRPSRPEAPRSEQRAQPPQHQQRPPQERQQPERQQQQEQRPRRREEDDDDFIPRHVNPLEQTFDRRFATSGKRGIPQGFGRGGSDPSHGNPGGDRGRGPGGERQPDPMKTSIGYIGADAFINRGNRGGRRGGGGGGGGGNGGGGRGRR
ncbi:pseudouridine synthase [Roseateles amylovorans]|uniref:Pseudouridine synthase n=1 Tax=Roseateles amylovorans TaxID=2978473 RepID=A0ABY6AV33_9BURK|nr:pseudouridine synthase [Roseateles amylovorans]UXH77071.1 pseudouridine synthase [Roseateles amylovorans]